MAGDRLVWIDLEMTGLDPERCRIVEIATAVTDAELDLVADGPSLVVHQPEPVLGACQPEALELHRRSGLLERVRAARLAEREAEAETLAFVRRHCEPRASPLCGNSVWKDRQFLERYMPELAAFLHYRTIDVSTIKELVRRWYPERFAAPPKRKTHRALDDIHESIAELRWYRRHVFVAPG
ncbi:MAG: oligoribonuclease [Deltaproteobacteria bacterium]|nr:oligoribonuclease [Deltaproteobacteria bacterium]